MSEDAPPKVIDTETVSIHCDRCTKITGKLAIADFAKWKEIELECTKNHNVAAALMEPEGLKKNFSTPERQYSLQYTGYLGDRDSKSFSVVSEAVPLICESKHIYKLGFCGHIKKRMGKRLIYKVIEHTNK